MSARTEGVALVVTAVFTLQMGAGLAVTLFDDVGPAGAVLLRLAIAAAVLWAIWRPRVERETCGWRSPSGSCSAR